MGAPLRVDSFLFNGAVVMYRGRILGVALKSYLPNYREYYEGRQFRPAEDALSKTITLCGQRDIPFGPDLLFEVENIPGFTFYIEICEDLWVPVPPSSFAALAGATVLANLSASNITIGKSEYRHSLAANQSARCVAAYLYAAAGPGESTTDLAWDGQAMAYENGTLLSESERFAQKAQMVLADIDLDRLVQDRMRLTSFSQNARILRDRVERYRKVTFAVELPKGRIPLARQYARFPYVPSDPAKRDERCYEAYNIQVQGLAKRLKASGIKNVVIGVSGGLDSTHALIVAARTMDLLGVPRSGVKAYTMPGFATTDKTYRNAHRLMKALGVEANEVDIRASCMQMFEDIGHPFAKGKKLYDITFENVQAGERTSHLFRLANLRNAIVLGTGDLSELALGWCTYGVGDHMSHYNVNVSVPKTLIQYLIRWVASTNQFDRKTSETLLDILATEISPELVPGVERQPAGPADRGHDRPLRAAGFQQLLHDALRLPAHEDRLHGLARLARQKGRGLAGCARREAKRIHDRPDQALAHGLPPAVLPDEPVQALLHPQRPQGGLRRVALAPGRLARAQRQRSRRMARKREGHPGKGAIAASRRFGHRASGIGHWVLGIGKK